MPTTPREHEAFCVIDRYGLITTFDSPEDAAGAVDPLAGRHLYVGRFSPHKAHRITLRQYRWLMVTVVLAGSVVLDVAENILNPWR